MPNSMSSERTGSPSIAQGSSPPSTSAPCAIASSSSSAVPGRLQQARLREGDDLDLLHVAACASRVRSTPSRWRRPACVSMSTWVRRRVVPSARKAWASASDWRGRIVAAGLRGRRARCRSCRSAGCRLRCGTSPCPRASCRGACGLRPGRAAARRRRRLRCRPGRRASSALPIAAMRPSRTSTSTGARPSGRTLRIRRASGGDMERFGGWQDEAPMVRARSTSRAAPARPPANQTQPARRKR